MKNKCLVKVLFMLIIDIITYNKKGEFVKIHPFYYQFVEKPPVKKAEGFCLLVVDKV